LWQTAAGMSDLIDAEGFRANVGIVLMRSDGGVFLGRRVGGRGWQCPQGGMREGENLEEALYRELQEEVGLAQEHVRLVGQTRGWLRYRLPARYVRRNRHPLCIGQKQRWCLLRLANDSVNFRLDTTPEPEFDQWRWVGYWEPVRAVVAFKRRVYVRALTELAPLAFPEGAPPAPTWVAEATASPRHSKRSAAALD
jgi:putative (di)nucleoside polyphosphate hydrolase